MHQDSHPHASIYGVCNKQHFVDRVVPHRGQQCASSPGEQGKILCLSVIQSKLSSFTFRDDSVNVNNFHYQHRRNKIADFFTL